MIKLLNHFCLSCQENLYKMNRDEGIYSYDHFFCIKCFYQFNADKDGYGKDINYLNFRIYIVLKQGGLFPYDDMNTKRNNGDYQIFLKDQNELLEQGTHANEQQIIDKLKKLNIFT